ncbi:MAG: phosphate/phosphite/phosphonate ABC transporter substrate-binding protein [Gammaproteobacteria bacterium]|nr:phosphate/phosphite/phosphonate ABC transporter substrate-binding protein [Gammaproteobacteria bacterium]MDH5653911.1 phosphate/phosphite/phosphonate ABC transporter substrate-binding protein [Gammaproteobacteria bacterium]
MINTFKVTLLSCTMLLLPFFSTSVWSEEVLVFSAPPLESRAAGLRVYEPVAQYLSKITGKKVIYQQPGNWPKYTSHMRNNEYDIVFDGAQFVSWRIKHLKHRPAVKVPGEQVFVFAGKKTNLRIKQVSDLIAKKVCGMAPPNLGTLHLYDLLDNPMRQPTLITVSSWQAGYQAMLDGKCDAVILPLATYRELDPAKAVTRPIYVSRPASGQAITVGPRISRQDFNKIRTALLDKKGQAALSNLRARFSASPLIAADPAEYHDVYSLLETSYGFDAYASQ